MTDGGVTVTQTTNVNRVRWAVACQVAQDLSWKPGLSQRVLVGTQVRVCLTCRVFRSRLRRLLLYPCSAGRQVLRTQTETPNLIRLATLPLGSALAFCCSVRNYPKCNSSEHHPFISSQLCSSWVWHGMAGVPLLRVPQGGNPGLAGSIPLWRHWARIGFRTHSGRWQNLVLCWLEVGVRGGSGPLKAACIPAGGLPSSPALSHAADPFPLCFQGPCH